jgi:hypothetical protein
MGILLVKNVTKGSKACPENQNLPFFLERVVGDGIHEQVCRLATAQGR